MSRLILLPYLQQWDGAQLSLTLLAAPQYSPLNPLVAGDASFTDADFVFEIRLVSGLSALPTTGTAFTPVTEATTAPAQARTLCTALASALGVDETVSPLDPRTPGRRFLKYAPPPYRAASGYADGGNPYLRVDDTYHCALKASVPAGTVLKSDPPVVGWGRALAAALRQPLLATDIGLLRSFTLTPDPHFFDGGGWVYVTLASGSPGAGLLATPGDLRSYAARVPALSAARRLFTSVLFPVADTVPATDYDDAFREVIDYDDGFAKAVYAAQPTVLDPLGEQDDGTRPRTDHGVRLGWDDEQVATWLNRQIDPAAATMDAPMGVLGYRVDARRAGDAAWHSLVLGTTQVTLQGIDLGSFSGEFQVEVAPNKLMADPTDTFWLPSYFTSWAGPSLVGLDPVEAQLRGLSMQSVIAGVDPSVSLRYGQDYEFRVRLVDHTGGGPPVDAVPANPAPQPLAPLHFLRWVRPPALLFDTTLPVTPDPTAAPSTLTVRRPLLGYPVCVFAGASSGDVLADLPAATAQNRAVGLPDPDVDAVEVEVSVAFPGTDSGYYTLYRTTRPFPAGPADSLVLDLDWVDVADATTLTAPVSGTLPVPTSRTVQVAVNALATDRADYYGADDVRHGPATTVTIRKPSADESGLLHPSSSEPVEGLFLQPDAVVTTGVAAAQQAAGLALQAPGNPLGRIADALNLVAVDSGLRAQPGHRVLFGCAPGPAHLIGPDGGSIQFSSIGDLTQVWVVAVRLELDRDWSWDGLDHLSIQQNGVEVGQVEPRLTVAHEAADGAPTDRSEIVFLDVFDPKPAPGQFPSEPKRHYTVTVVFRDQPVTADPDPGYDLHLPITTPPSQVPKLAAAGLALSPYERDAAYSRTGVRTKMLWFEFTEPPGNPADGLFARVLADAPDPVLLGDLPDDLPETPEPPLPIDPEPIRTIVPGQSDDQAGLSAMQPLQPTTSPVHFFVPLPPGMTANYPELFGFFTYELRVGHVNGWSTAQGRFGRPLRVTGVQHPAPPLAVAVNRSKIGVEVSAPVATPALNGRPALFLPPATQLWALLYAQVHQADDTEIRNLLLGNRQAQLLWERNRLQRATTGTATWSQAELERLLAELGLGPDTPLSCLVVETLPGAQPVVDPVGAGLGYERFLRTSPLTTVPAQC